MRAAVAAAVAICGLAVWAPVASATFHEVRVREVYPGSAASPNAEYIELQAYESGQNFLLNHVIKTYNAAGALIESNKFTKDAPRGPDQATFLLATPEAEAQFGVAADGGFTGSANQLDPAGGAVCWEALDCVSWGSFSGLSLPSPAGTPAAAIADGMALRRTIAPGCATRLEESDDRNNSSTDFAAVFPAPRPNSVTPSEHACSSGGGGGGGGGGPVVVGGGGPQTTLKRKPAKKSRDRTPTFRFSSGAAYATFQCKIDRGKFRACRSPFTTKKLSLGSHTFKVRAKDDSGKVDASPASYSFKIVKPR